MIRDMDDEAIRAELAVCEAADAGPWEPHPAGAKGGNGIRINGPDVGRITRNVRTAADATFIAAARTGYPDALREVLRLREALAAAEARGYARGVEAAAQICDAAALDRRNTSAACQEAKYLAGTIRALDRVHAADRAAYDATRSARDEALAQCAVMRAALETAPYPLYWTREKQQEWDVQWKAALAPGAGAALLAAIRRVLDCPPEDDHDAQTALRELLDGGGA